MMISSPIVCLNINTSDRASQVKFHLGKPTNQTVLVVILQKKQENAISDLEHMKTLQGAQLEEKMQFVQGQTSRWVKAPMKWRCVRYAHWRPQTCSETSEFEIRFIFRLLHDIIMGIWGCY